MISAIVFILVAVLPFIIYLVNMLNAQRDRGIAGGIPKAKQAKEPKRRTRPARVNQRRVTYCGRDFTHLVLAVFGSQDSCRHCTYLQEVPPPADPGGGSGPESDAGSGLDADTDAAVRAAEEIIDQAKQ